MSKKNFIKKERNFELKSLKRDQEQQFEQMKRDQEQKLLKEQQEKERIEKARQEEIEKQKAEELERKQQLEVIKKRKQRKLSDLPGEPDENSGTIKLAFRLPNGSRLMRRFLPSDKLEVIQI